MKKSFFLNHGIWLKGNIHCHSTVSDGYFKPEEIIALYHDREYDFLSITDHNIVKQHKDFFPDMILLEGIEHDLTFSKYKNIHVVGISAKSGENTSYDCRKYLPDELTMQQLINLMHNDGQFVTIAHPIWSRLEPEEIVSLHNYNAIEAFNNGCENLCHAGHGEVYLDLVLRRGTRVFTTAVDDTHKPVDLFGGWIELNAEEKTKEEILHSLFSGYYYSTSGPRIFDFGIDGDQIYFSCSPCREIHIISWPPRGKSCFAEGNSLLTECIYKLKGGEKYLRMECIDAAGKTAWTNPVYFDENEVETNG